MISLFLVVLDISYLGLLGWFVGLLRSVASESGFFSMWDDSDFNNSEWIASFRQELSLTTLYEAANFAVGL